MSNQFIFVLFSFELISSLFANSTEFKHNAAGVQNSLKSILFQNKTENINGDLRNFLKNTTKIMQSSNNSRIQRKSLVEKAVFYTNRKSTIAAMQLIFARRKEHFT